LILLIDEIRRQIEINLIGPAIVIQALAPLLGADRQLKGRPGRVVNIGSVGGRVATPFLAPHHASKFGVEGLPESLRRELLCYEIDVIVRAFGGSDGDLGQARADRHHPLRQRAVRPRLERLRAYMLALGKGSLAPERLGQALMHALATARPKVRYSVRPPRVQDWLGRKLPKRLIDRMIGGGWICCRRGGKPDPGPASFALSVRVKPQNS